MKVISVVGARPNFIKVAPLLSAMQEYGETFQSVLVHTGQHYDYQMSRLFFEELEMPDPDEFLNVGSGTHAEQTARVMLAFEPVVVKHHPDWVIVVGDVNSTLACALVCAKLNVRLAHVEAGLRSWDRSMPEEINRLLTDQLADLLFTPSRDGDANLLREGIPPEKIHFVGNVMIDTLVKMLPRALHRPVLEHLGLKIRGYILVTLHRPSNVDQPETLLEILQALDEIGQDYPVVFPVHPRTRQQIDRLGGSWQPHHIRLLEPLGYLDFLALENAASLVLTDSGGIQEETCSLGVPCLTLRPTTERPVTIQSGLNRLVASRRPAILSAVKDALAVQASLSGQADRKMDHQPPELWDGHAARRIVRVLLG